MFCWLSFRILEWSLIRKPTLWYKASCPGRSLSSMVIAPDFYLDYPGKRQNFPVSLRTCSYMPRVRTMGYERNDVCNFQEVILKKRVLPLSFSPPLLSSIQLIRRQMWWLSCHPAQYSQSPLRIGRVESENSLDCRWTKNYHTSLELLAPLLLQEKEINLYLV